MHWGLRSIAVTKNITYLEAVSLFLSASKKQSFFYTHRNPNSEHAPSGNEIHLG